MCPQAIEKTQVDSIKDGHFLKERIDLAAIFRWTARLGMQQGVSNHYSAAVSEDGRRFLANPNQRLFSGIKASDLLLLDADDSSSLDHVDAPDPTAWGLHSSLHRRCPHARCVIHAHPKFTTVLASLADSRLPPIDHNTAMFFNRYVIDEQFGGLAFEEEGEHCALLFSDPRVKTMIMANHGVLVLGSSVADAYNRFYYFERAAGTYIRALQTGKPLRIIPDEIAEKTAREIEEFPEQADRHLEEIKAVLDREEPSYRN